MKQPVLEGYEAMTKALRHDPIALYEMLTARKKDLLKMKGSKKDPLIAAMVDEALVGVDNALAKTVARLEKIAAAEEEESEKLSDEFSIPDDAPPLDLSKLEEDAGDEAQLEDEAPTDEPMAEEAPEAEPAPAPEAAEPEKEDSPVAMSAKLRKAMGEIPADMLDDYALKIHKSVVTFFENLTKKALDLGTEDATDSANSLREVLLAEVGKRGLASVEANFLEWRESLIKKLWKDVSAMFAVPETEEQKSSDFPVDVPPTPDSVPPPEPEEETPAPEAGAAEVVVEEPPADTAASPQPIASASALVVTAAPVRFTIHKDMKPAGMKSVKLT